jgi:hypothetical protein
MHRRYQFSSIGRSIGADPEPNDKFAITGGIRATEQGTQTNRLSYEIGCRCEHQVLIKMKPFYLECPANPF